MSVLKRQDGSFSYKVILITVYKISLSYILSTEQIQSNYKKLSKKGKGAEVDKTQPDSNQPSFKSLNTVHVI